MDALDRAWLAGLLEGEGYFAWHHDKRDSGRPEVSLEMADRDVVDRAAVLMGGNSVHALDRTKDRPGHSITFRTRISGRKAVALMRDLLPLMGSRRKEKINELLAAWDARQG